MPHGLKENLLVAGTDPAEVVATWDHSPLNPESVWERVRMYEDIPCRPPLLLRFLLRMPLGTEGDKLRAGAAVRCTYARGGHLIKLMRIVEPPRRIEFDVVEQRLGIERAITLLGGSYEFKPDAGGTRVVLTTFYLGHLRPRFFWRPIESILAHRLHRHILQGMRAPVLCSRISVQNVAEGRSRVTAMHS